MMYWVLYDVSDNNVRTRVANKCKNYGLERVQKSAFIGQLTANRKEMLSQEIRDSHLSDTDCVFILPTCKTCFAEKDILGDINLDKVNKKAYVIFTNE